MRDIRKYNIANTAVIGVYIISNLPFACYAEVLLCRILLKEDICHSEPSKAVTLKFNGYWMLFHCIMFAVALFWIWNIMSIFIMEYTCLQNVLGGKSCIYSKKVLRCNVYIDVVNSGVHKLACERFSKFIWNHNIIFDVTTIDWFVCILFRFRRVMASKNIGENWNIIFSIMLVLICYEITRCLTSL